MYMNIHVKENSCILTNVKIRAKQSPGHVSKFPFNSLLKP